MHPAYLFPKPAVSAALNAGRSSGSRIFLAPLLPAPFIEAVDTAGFVPGYSGGTAPDSHRLPH